MFFNEKNSEFEDVDKSSFELRELIKEDDYVNGCKVYVDDLFGKYIIIWEEDSNYYRKIYLASIDIKSIVTKEMMASMEYKVGEK